MGKASPIIPGEVRIDPEFGPVVANTVSASVVGYRELGGDRGKFVSVKQWRALKPRLRPKEDQGA